MPTRISDLSEFYTVSASMYVPIVDLLATGSNKNKKISLIELFKFYQTTSSYTTTTPGFFYFGDNRDGDGNFSSSVQVSSSFSSVTDGDPIIKNFSSLFISESLLISPTNRCDGMLIFVDGDCIISGSLSMTAKGASGVGIDASFFPLNPPNLGYYWNDVVFPSSSYRSLVSFTGSAGNSKIVGCCINANIIALPVLSAISRDTSVKKLLIDGSFLVSIFSIRVRINSKSMYILDGNEYEEFADTTENPSVLISAFLIPGNICNDALNAAAFVGVRSSNLYVSCI